ncbi:VOC family protein [Paenibacillus sp. YIM B09110]|uniref:VOC family protein n=1 Tax=Paenibacillus sp. YIM B09110 TaxID=3126102 RepID=UPI00301C93C1
MPFTFVGIDHVQLAAPAGCEKAARSFFGGVLGWIEIRKPERLIDRGGVWFQCGKHQVHIGVQKNFIPAEKAHPAFQVKHIAALRENLIQHQITVIDDDNREDEGLTRFFLNDPFGNRIEFIESGEC